MVREIFLFPLKNGVHVRPSMGGESGSEKVCLVCICVLLPTIFREGKEGREEGQIKKRKESKGRLKKERKKVLIQETNHRHPKL